MLDGERKGEALAVTSLGRCKDHVRSIHVKKSNVAFDAAFSTSACTTKHYVDHL